MFNVIFYAYITLKFSCFFLGFVSSFSLPASSISSATFQIAYSPNPCLCLCAFLFKGSLAGGFRFQNFFLNQLTPGLLVSQGDHLEFFTKIRGDMRK
jgi:hypothetical protein